MQDDDDASDDEQELDDERDLPIPPWPPNQNQAASKRHAERVNTRSRPPANISQMALNAVLGRAIMETSGIYTPNSLSKVALTFNPPTDLEEMANGVVNPVTKETMTKYVNIIKVPELCDVWLQAMCKELG